MDLDGSGQLDKFEIKAGYKEFYNKALTKKELDDMFALLDTDGSGYIEYTEFVIASMNERNLL
jgi:Ca2+-binding EF-hand superfamily protein